jgi:hypothetical protein
MKSTRKDDAIFPVMKIDYNFNVIYCNEPAYPVLSKWNCRPQERLPLTVLDSHPGIYTAIKSTQTPDIEVEMDDVKVKCTVVPFPEAGYIGIYAYMIEYTEKTKERVTLARFN